MTLVTQRRALDLSNHPRMSQGKGYTRPRFNTVILMSVSAPVQLEDTLSVIYYMRILSVSAIYGGAIWFPVWNVFHTDRLCYAVLGLC